MTVRVTRLMEYEFATVEQALAHLESMTVPANGVKQFGTNSSPQPVTIRSAVIGPVVGEAAEAPAVEQPAPTGGEVVSTARGLVYLWAHLLTSRREAIRSTHPDFAGQLDLLLREVEKL